MERYSRRLAFVLVITIAVVSTLALVGSPVESQAGTTTVSVSGTVVDETTGTLLTSAVIMIPGTELGTLTDEHGEYVIHGVDPGNLVVHATRLGYIPERRLIWVCTPVNDADGNCHAVGPPVDKRLNFYMRPAPPVFQGFAW